MKLLVCTDGSEHSKKALEKALEIAGGCSVDEVAIINVYEEIRIPQAMTDRISIAPEDAKRFEKLEELDKEEQKAMLDEAAGSFKQKNIKVKTLAECGHPAETIARTAEEGGYDMIIIGSRGLGGLKKYLLGSVSNSVLQEAKTSVLVVK